MFLKNRRAGFLGVLSAFDLYGDSFFDKRSSLKR